MIVHVLSEHPRGRAAAARLRRRAGEFLRHLGREDAELSLVLVGDRGIRRLNRCWRGKDEATDVLSFPLEGTEMIGDVVLSLDTAARVAASEGRRVSEELDRYLAHGILHLLGHDHERPRDAARMAALEAELLGEAGLIRKDVGPVVRRASSAQSGVRAGSGSRSGSRSGSESRSGSGSGSRSGSGSESRSGSGKPRSAAKSRPESRR